MLLVVAGGGGVTEGMELRGGAAPPPPPPPPAVRLGWSVPTAEDKVVTARERERWGSSASTKSPIKEAGVNPSLSFPPAHSASPQSEQTRHPCSLFPEPRVISLCLCSGNHYPNNLSKSSCHLLNLCQTGAGSANHALNHFDTDKKWGTQEIKPHLGAPSRGHKEGIGMGTLLVA